MIDVSLTGTRISEIIFFLKASDPELSTGTCFRSLRLLKHVFRFQNLERKRGSNNPNDGSIIVGVVVWCGQDDDTRSHTDVVAEPETVEAL
jgi:hypothetical protein